MATAKKKSTAKRTVKYAAKNQSAASHAAVKAAKGAASAGNYWAQKGADQWQKGAQDWMSHGSKMLQFPQGGGDFSEAASQAAATMQSATQNAMKMGSDFMGQLFGGTMPAMPDMASFTKNLPSFGKMPSFASMPGMGNLSAAFNPSGAQGAMSSIARESAEQFQKTAGSANRAVAEAMELSRENTEAAVEVTSVAIATSKELGAGMISYLNKMFSQNVELSKQALSCRTLNDMFDLASRAAKTNLEGFFTESVKLSELLFQSATDISEPMNERISTTTERLSKAMAA